VTLSSASSSLPSLSNFPPTEPHQEDLSAVIDADECHSRIKLEPETFVIRISHGSGSISATVPDGDLSARKLLDELGVMG